MYTNNNLTKYNSFYSFKNYTITDPVNKKIYD